MARGIFALLAFATFSILLSGCPGNGGDGDITPTPGPTQACPSECEFGCRPGTGDCLDSPLCPAECRHGCVPGTGNCFFPCPSECRAGCIEGTSECAPFVECPEDCIFGCIPGTGQCADPTPFPSATPSPSRTPWPTPSLEKCNIDYHCDPVLGETDENCPSDCVPPTFCKYPTSGLVNFDIACARYRLGTSGLYLEAYYPSVSGQNISIIGFKCTAEAGNPETEPASLSLLPGERGVLASGNVTCHNSDGSVFEGEPGDFFEGRLLIDYAKGGEPTIFRETLSFRTAVRGAC